MRYNIHPLILITILVILLFYSPAIAEKQRILYLDSYHQEYSWSVDIARGIQSVLANKKNIEMKTFHMDTKRNKSEAFKTAAALKAKNLIDTWKPDVVIASDDNASKYLIVPYYKDKDLPFVFCGLNWDAGVYGFPAKNVTGMLEVALFDVTINALKKFARGDKIGYIASDTVSEHKELENIQKKFSTNFDVRFTKTFEELKSVFLDLQKTCDMILIQECRSVKGFNHMDMIRFINANTVIPTGTMVGFLADYAMITFSKIGEEQGEYAAKTALEILNGKPPGEIPIAVNKKAKIHLNMKLAKKLGITFPVEMIENAELISAKRKKVLFVNSYHKGYRWSDDIEKGLLKSLDILKNSDGSLNTDKSDVLLKIIRMDTKKNTSEAFKKKAALKAKAVIEEWEPDILVASDDNASKYLVAPYLKNTSLPVVFCGINWDASIYGFPASNLTGMVEIAPYLETVNLLKKYSEGDRVGMLAGNTYSGRKEAAHIKKIPELAEIQVSLVEDFSAWKEAYLRFQEEADMLILNNEAGIKQWDQAKAEDFIFKHSKIASGTASDNSVSLVLMGLTNIAEEQGWWAGQTALEILQGRSPSDIPVVTNKQTKLFLNMKLARQMNITFPMELIEKSIFTDE